MNDSNPRDESPIRNGKGDHLNETKNKKQKKKSNSNINTFGNSKNSILKELLQMKQENNKMAKEQLKAKSDLLDENSMIKQSGLAFKNRKLSADHHRYNRNDLKEMKQTNRSRKSNSSKPTHRVSRADSRDTSTRSQKEDSKSAIGNDVPANNQIPPDSDKENNYVNEDVNVVTKFAFATRVGYIPNNPYKVNQDAYILSPNIMKMPAFHYFGVCDGHGQNGKEVSGYVKQRLPVLLENFVKSTGDDKKALSEAFVTVNSELDYVPFDCQFSGTT